jgi:hypothetical protein
MFSCMSMLVSDEFFWIKSKKEVDRVHACVENPHIHVILDANICNGYSLNSTIIQKTWQYCEVSIWTHTEMIYDTHTNMYTNICMYFNVYLIFFQVLKYVTNMVRSIYIQEICIYIYAYMYICVYTYICVYIYMCIYIYICVCVYIYVYICMCVYMYICI